MCLLVHVKPIGIDVCTIQRDGSIGGYLQVRSHIHSAGQHIAVVNHLGHTEGMQAPQVDDLCIDAEGHHQTEGKKDKFLHCFVHELIELNEFTFFVTLRSITSARLEG